MPRARRLSGTLDVDGKRASWAREGPSARPLVFLAHGAGAPYTSPFMEAVAAGLVRRDLASVRFHFPYMEEFVASGKRRPPNPQKTLLATWEAMLAKAATWKNLGPFVLAGKSMGGRMASMLLAQGRAPSAAVAAVYLGYPLHPPGRPEKLRSEHLSDVGVPQLFVSGSKDNLCKLELLRPVLRKLGSRATLHVVEGGDHSLVVSRKEPMKGFDAWLDRVAEWVLKVAG